MTEYEDNYQKYFDEANKLNQLDLESFKKVPFSQRVLFASHCLLADVFDKIEKMASELGYKTYKVGGGSAVKRIMREEKPEAVVGIACYNEIIKMKREMVELNINLPAQVILLANDGCENTNVDLAIAEKILTL